MFGEDQEAEKLRLAKTLSAQIKQDFLSRFGVNAWYYLSLPLNC
jgi:hypothetical protein